MNWNKLSHSSKTTQLGIQNKKFRFLINHLIPYHPFYRKKFQDNKWQYKSFKNLSDLEKISFSSKNDILPTKNNPGKARDFILQPNEQLIAKYAPKSVLLKIIIKKILRLNFKADLEKEFKPIHIHFTTGRSAGQIPYLYTTYDLKQLDETSRRLFDVLGVSSDDIVINGFPYAPHLAFWLGVAGNRANQILMLNTGGGKILGTDKIIDAIEKLKATVLIFIPGYGYHVLREAIRQKRDFSSVKTVIFGGERLSPALREKIKEMLGELGAKKPRVLATYASTEAKAAWAQCHENSGYHLYPDLEYIELVDEKGKPVKEGEPGEIVFTALDWRGSMVMRYKTGDYCKSLLTTPCEYCGRTVPRLHYDIERKFDNIELNLTKIKGEIVNLNTFYTLIHQIDGIDDWQVEIAKLNNDTYELDEVIINISLRKHAEEGKIKKELLDLVQEKTSLTPTVKIHDNKVMVDLLGLDRELKEKRIVDLRKK